MCTRPPSSTVFPDLNGRALPRPLARESLHACEADLWKTHRCESAASPQRPTWRTCGLAHPRGFSVWSRGLVTGACPWPRLSSLRTRVATGPDISRVAPERFKGIFASMDQPLETWLPEAPTLPLLFALRLGGVPVTRISSCRRDLSPKRELFPHPYERPLRACTHFGLAVHGARNGPPPETERCRSWMCIWHGLQDATRPFLCPREARGVEGKEGRGDRR